MERKLVFEEEVEHVCVKPEELLTKSDLELSSELKQSFANVHNMRNAILQEERYACPVFQLSKLLSIPQENVQKTGMQAMDWLLHGGMRLGQIIHLMGESNTGKTQLGMQIATNLALQYSYSTLFLDTCNSINMQRMLNMMMLVPGNTQSTMPDLTHVSISRVFQLDALLLQLDRLLCREKLPHRMIVIDSMNSILCAVPPVKKGYHVNWGVAGVISGLIRRICERHQCIVLIMSTITTQQQQERKPWYEDLGHVRLHMERLHDNNIQCKRKTSVNGSLLHADNNNNDDDVAAALFEITARGVGEL